MSDNEAIYGLCQNVSITRQSYDNINRLIGKVISNSQFKIWSAEMNVDLNIFQTNLVSFQRLHFMTTSTAPVLAPRKNGK